MGSCGRGPNNETIADRNGIHAQPTIPPEPPMPLEVLCEEVVHLKKDGKDHHKSAAR